jgi:hypothetical protein
MEHKEQVVYALRERKQSHYDKRLILKIRGNSVNSWQKNKKSAAD